MTNKEKNLVEVARSFTMKVNTGNYTSADFFCSRKEEVEAKDAEKASEVCYQFCKREVLRAVNQMKAELADPLTTLRKRYEENPTPTVEQWEAMSPEEQHFRQEKKKGLARDRYADLKKKKQDDAVLENNQE